MREYSLPILFSYCTYIRKKAQQSSPLRKMNLCRVICLLFWFYKIVGLGTFSLNKKILEKKEKCSKNVFFFVKSKLGIVYNFLLSCFVIMLYYIVVPFVNDVEYPYKTKFTGTLELSQVLLGCFMTCFILLYFCSNQSAFVRIGNCLILATDTLCRLQQPLSRTNLLCLFIIAYIFNFILLLTLGISEVLTTSAPYLYHVGTITPVAVLSLFFIQYFTVLVIANAIFVAINRIIKQIQRSSIDDFNMKIFYNRRLFVSSSGIQLLVQMRELHDYVCNVSTEISRLYSLPTLIVLCFIFYSFLYNVYYFFGPLIMNASFETVIEITAEVCELEIYLRAEAFKWALITLQIESTGNIVHALLNRVIDRETKAELEQFSLQLLHRKVKFTAYGYFTLDNSLLRAMIGTVATYMVILIQFQMETPPKTRADNCTQQ
ncbi:putative gustatory receptor 28b isoform X3 [Ceratina calcarata]|uniref:Gustatory receptor n=1 Tax=Ceratina calcarata TaxID=156304 RepID=A0AAJ7WBM5_9HYME|nr:putative gustatory receptor 28b isoform X3 [Ceratina calcarata]